MIKSAILWRFLFGFYQYYFLELVGFDGNESIKKHDYSEVMKTLDEFNKNKDGYYNIIDGKYYSKNVTKNNAVNLSGKLVDSLAEDDSLTGISLSKSQPSVDVPLAFRPAKTAISASKLFPKPTLV